MIESKTLSFALAGNPNAGKTTLFNRLTGSRQHVGNYPGITVDKKEGFCAGPDGKSIRMVDLPGIYSLTAYSMEEIVARNFLADESPDVVINIVDSSNLQRNLYLTVQLIELGCRVVIALNMIDIAKQRGIEIDADKLSSLLGVPVCPVIARDGVGLDQLLLTTVQAAESKKIPTPLYISYGDDVDNTLVNMQALIEEKEFLNNIYPSRWLATKYLEEDKEVLTQGMEENKLVADKLSQMGKQLNVHTHRTLGVNSEAIIADHRYGFIKSVLANNVVKRTFSTDRLYTSDKIDQFLTNRFLGPLVMFTVLLGLYEFTFTLSEHPVAWLEAFFAWFSSLVDSHMPDGLLKSMIVSGVIDGVGGVLGFVPLIMFMFLGIAFLEDSGYLARVAFMMDRVFRSFGLHGSSVMAFIVSGGVAGGCAVPGVMATRTLRSKRERMATLLTVPFMNCGAKIPVLALLTGTFFAENQAATMFLLTVLAWLVALIVAKILRLTVLKGASTPFVMELPPYRFPTFRGLLIHTWERTWQYIKKAGTVILAISILLWAMMSFPGLPNEKKLVFDSARQDVLSSISLKDRPLLSDKSVSSPSELPVNLKAAYKKLQEIDKMEAGEVLKNSFAGRIGRGLEYVTKDLTGFDWRTNIALIGGVAAKEVVISTLGTAYSLGNLDEGSAGSLSKTLLKNPNWNRVTALSVIIFVMFYAPCFVTVVCICRESGSWKWGAFSVLFNTIFAFFLSTALFQIGSLICKAC